MVALGMPMPRFAQVRPPSWLTKTPASLPTTMRLWSAGSSATDSNGTFGKLALMSVQWRPASDVWKRCLPVPLTKLLKVTYATLGLSGSTAMLVGMPLGLKFGYATSCQLAPPSVVAKTSPKLEPAYMKLLLLAPIATAESA